MTLLPVHGFPIPIDIESELPMRPRISDAENLEDRELEELISKPAPEFIRQMSRKFHLYERLKALGFDSVNALMETLPNRTYYEISEKEFSPPVMPIVLQRAHALELIELGETRRFAIEMLVREMRYALAGGWIHRKGEPLLLKTVMAASTLAGELKTAGAALSDREAADRAWKAPLELEPPQGWLPKDINDPLIQKAFDIGWPEQSTS